MGTEYEMPDGSIFSLCELWDYRQTPEQFLYTSVTAVIDGQPYAARAEQRAEEVDHFAAAEDLVKVPPEKIYPPIAPAFLRVSHVDAKIHHLKAPSFTYGDVEAADTFVADCVLREVEILELFRTHPHPNVVKYHGCVVSGEGRITHICLQKVRWGFFDYVDEFQPSVDQLVKMMRGLHAAITHLHSLGYAHNDIHEQNVRVDDHHNAVLIDFDSCLPFGAKILKGGVSASYPISSAENDFQGLEAIGSVLQLPSAPEMSS